MKPEPNTGPLHVFIHVPKAAGSSVRSLIESNYKTKHQMQLYRTGGTSLHDLLTDCQNEGQFDTARVAYGHVPAVLHNYTDRHCDYFTFLREPEARAASFYKFVKHDFPDHALHKKFQSGEVTFKMFCNRNHIEANKMTMMLSGHDKTRVCTPEMLEAAKESLKNFAYFGFFEEFDQAIQDCGVAMNWDMSQYQVRNISSKTNSKFFDEEGVTEKDLKNLAYNNRFDRELYDFALDLREKRKMI